MPLLFEKRVHQIRQTKNLLKKIYKDIKLCYSINEADRRFAAHFSFVRATRPDRQNILADQGFNVGRVCVVSETQEI